MNKNILLITLILTTVILSSCKSNIDITDVSEQDTTTTTDIEENSRISVPDNLPVVDYKGESFNISTKQGYLYEIYTEEEDGEILNDALFARNRTVEERFNITIKPIITEAGDGSTHVNSVINTVLAGDDVFDLAATYVFTSGPIVTQGLYNNWLNIDYVDFSKPWWINGINEKFRIKDSIFTAVGDMCVSTLTLTYGVFYNINLAEIYSIENLNELVKTNKWTIDKFISIKKEVYEDLNGDSIFDNNDIYGFTAEAATNLDIYTFAFDIPIISQNSDGIPELVLNTSKTIHAVELINQLYWNDTGSYIASSDFMEPINMFKNGKALFTTTWLGNAFGAFRDMENDYGILPYPKYDEHQEIYMTGAMDNYSVLGVPVTVSDTERVGIIVEALNAESYKTLFPAYYEQALQTKYSRDIESIEMIDILMAGRNFDMVTLFSNEISGMAWIFRTLVAGKNIDFVSNYAAKETAALTGLSKVIEAYEENK